MGFTITDSDGNVQKEVWSCTDCLWLSTKRHCRSTEDGPACTMCGSPCEQIDTFTKTTGMPDYQYQELLSYVEDEVDGVGSATVSAIEQHFEQGDDFLDAAEVAYQQIDTDQLEVVDGVGTKSAKQIALGLAELKGWEDGAIFEFNR